MRFAWHVHHNILLEALTEPIPRRADYIRKHKPKSEQALRLRLLKVVRGKLPTKYVEAWKAHDKAREAHDKARKVYSKTLEAYIKAGKAYDKAREARAKARGACENEINALHAKECPDCPWDGTTIFTAPEV